MGRKPGVLRISSFGFARKGDLVASGVAAFGMMFRAIAVMVVLLAVAASDPHLGLAAAITYALAYTVELGLSLVTYFGNPPV